MASKVLKTTICIAGAALFAGACATGGNPNAGQADAGAVPVGDSAAPAADAGALDQASPPPPPPPRDAGAAEAEAAPPDDTPVAADARDRFGMYAWGVDPSSKPAQADTLAWSTGKAAALGTRTIRVYLGPNDVYGVLGGAFSTLAAAAALPAYDALFKSPAFDTYFLTAYSSYDQANGWRVGMTPADRTAEQSEIAALGAYLLGHYPKKTFVLSNWEGDNAIAPYAAVDAAWSGFQDWTTARAQGVVEARARVPASTAKVFSALEMNRLHADDGSPCDTAAHRCVANMIAAHVAVDYYAYSAWQSLAVGVKDADLPARVKADLDLLIGYLRMQDPTATRARVVVGELGAAREVPGWGECGASGRIAAALGAVLAWGPAYAFHWQIVDNAPTADSATSLGFGVYKSNGDPSLSEAVYKTLYTTQAVVPPTVTLCPGIFTGGIVNGAPSDAGTLPITPTTVLSIYGSGFSPVGNRVQIWQGTQRYEVTAGSPGWYESGGQINAALPSGITTGTARVYVRASTGVDSNAGVITIQ